MCGIYGTYIVCPKCLGRMILVNNRWYCTVCGFEVENSVDLKTASKIRLGGHVRTALLH